MKKIILLFVASILLFSCAKNDKKEGYYGKWIAINNPLEKPAYITISSDSIAYGENEVIRNTFPVSISNQSLTFSQQTFKSSISEGLLHIENQSYKKITIKNPVEVTLPKLKGHNFDELLLTDQVINISYGKKPNTDTFYIRFNEKVFDIDAIQKILIGLRNDVYRNLQKVALYCDENVTMKDIEFLFLHINQLGFRNVFLVNSIDQKFNTPLGENKRNIRFHSIKFLLDSNPEYRMEVPMISSNTRLDQMTFFVKENKPFQYTFLINNECYFGKEKLSKQAFSSKLKSLIKNKTPLLMLYDLKSNYKNYLEIISIYKQLLDEERNNTAISLYDASFETLDAKQKDHIRHLHRYINIRQYSIPHFLSFGESSMENIDFPFKNVKEQLPEAYFKK